MNCEYWDEEKKICGRANERLVLPLDVNIDEAIRNDEFKVIRFADVPEPKIENRWISVTERLPESEEEVVICAIRKTYGEKKPIITTAMYEDGTVRDNDSRWNWENIDWAGWDDEEDCGIIPEGWWEYRHYNPDDVYNNLVDDFVVAWMPLPEPWKGDEE